MTDRYAVIGNPVAHSQSPRIHAMFARSLGEDVEYGTILGRAGRFAEDVQAFRQSGGCGLNVTVPFKLDAFELATERSASATYAGAVNTLKFDGEHVIGDNTDGAGLVRDIRTGPPQTRSARADPSSAAAPTENIVADVVAALLANRTPAKAQTLAARFKPQATGVTLSGGSYEDAGGPFDLVINATSASLADALPPLSPDMFAKGALAYDMVYGERAKRFVACSMINGAARAADGLGMLVEQAAESFFLWRGVRPVTKPVLAALRERDAETVGANAR